MIMTMITTLQTRLEKRRQYMRLIAEIEKIDAREMQDLRADPIEMRRQAWQSIYG